MIWRGLERRGLLELSDPNRPAVGLASDDIDKVYQIYSDSRRAVGILREITSGRVARSRAEVWEVGELQLVCISVAGGRSDSMGAGRLSCSRVSARWHQLRSRSTRSAAQTRRAKRRRVRGDARSL
jgi:hypothetical protein